MEFRGKTTLPSDKDSLLGVPIWEGALDTSALSPAQISTLTELDFYTVVDLWDDDTGDYWAPSIIKNRWASPAQRDALGGQFKTAWRTFIAALPANVKRTLAAPDYTPHEGEYVGYLGVSGDTYLGKYYSYHNKWRGNFSKSV